MLDFVQPLNRHLHHQFLLETLKNQLNYCPIMNWDLIHEGTKQQLLSLNSSRILRRISLVWENEFTIKQYDFTETGDFDVDFCHITKVVK